MSEDLHPYNDFFKKKLENHESSVPDDLFDNIMRKRGGASDTPSDATYNAFFQKKLSDHESPVNDDLFDRLIRNREGTDEQPSDAPMRAKILAHSEAVPKPTFEAIIEERERRRRAIVWRFAAALLLLLASYLLFLNKNSETNNNEGKTNQPVNLGENKAQVSNDLNDNKINARTVAEGNTRGNQSAITQSPNNQSTIINNQSKNTEGGNTLSIDRSLTVNSQSQNHSITKSLNHPITQSLTKTTISQNTVSNSTSLITEQTAEQQIIIPTVPTFTDLKTAVVADSRNLNGRALEAQNNVASNAPLFSQTNNDLTLNNATPLFDNLSIFRLKNIALPSRDLTNPCKIGPGDGCPTFGKQRKRGGEKSIYIDVYGAPEYAFRRITANLPEMAAYLKARDTVESPWYAFSAGVRGSVVFKNGLAFRTGFVYNQTNEIAVFDSLGIGKKEITETYPPRPGGGVDTVRTTKITSGIFRTTKYNRYRSIDIPLQLGFEFPMNDYWSFSVNGGVNFNLSAWRKADILNEKRTRQEVSSKFGETNTVFRNSLGLSIFGSVAAYRQLTGNLQLVIEPSVRHYLQPITRSDFALNQAYTNAGLILGLRYKL